MKRAIWSLLVLGAAITGSASQAADERPSWCPAGYQCLRNEELARDTIYKIRLEQEILNERAKRKRFGCVAGGGFGKTWVVSEELDVRGLYGVGLNITCGLRFP